MVTLLINIKDSGDDNFNLGQARPHRSTETAKEINGQMIRWWELFRLL